MKKVITVALFLACTHAQAAGGPSQGLSEASKVVAGGSVVVTFGTLSVLAGSGQLVVGSMQAVGDGLEVVVKSVADGASATLRFSAQAAKGLGIAVGTAVQVIGTSTGHALVASGKVLAFIPNETGKALLHHSRKD
jgi:hypothetical protein